MNYEIVVAEYKSKYKGILIDDNDKIVFNTNYSSKEETALRELIDELIRRQK